MAAPAQTVLRLVTFNVHSWGDDEWHPNQERVGKLLKSLRAHVVSLNEVLNDQQTLEYIAAAIAEEPSLPMKYTFGEALMGFGNAILVEVAEALPFALTAISSTKLLADAAYSKMSLAETRNLTTVKMTVKPTAQPRPLLTDFIVHSTHLDHEFEQVRIQQLQVLLDKHVPADGDTPHIIMGDFNALTFGDYSPEYLKMIDAQRTKNYWEGIHDQVATLMKDRGYIDLFSRLNSTNVQDKAVGTCRFWTRIDYIYLSKQWEALVDWEQSACSILQTSTCSDHFPVFGQLVLK